MKTPEEIFDEIHPNALGEPDNLCYRFIRQDAIQAMKEFGRQAWISADADFAVRKKSIFNSDLIQSHDDFEGRRYEQWFESLYSDQHP